MGLNYYPIMEIKIQRMEILVGLPLNSNRTRTQNVQTKNWIQRNQKKLEKEFSDDSSLKEDFNEEELEKEIVKEPTSESKPHMPGDDITKSENRNHTKRSN
ncbi:unnamed protein product [Hymenolepis diminuta]|uniref:Uncharacterized protein n=1 Tax=Hymenolepis diminuta TaxID=6216 RepID=A0A564Y487_HYMDI|nr:unnamed protein product [Hymenolepis diminuta]